MANHVEVEASTSIDHRRISVKRQVLWGFHRVGYCCTGDIARGMEQDLTFPQIIDGLSAPIATTTSDGRVEFANKQFLDYLGVSLEELKSWESSGVVHPDDLARVVTAWRQSLERGEPFEIELRVRRAGGVYQWVQVRGLPLRDAQGLIVHWCVLLTDIAERTRTQALLDG